MKTTRIFAAILLCGGGRVRVPARRQAAGDLKAGEVLFIPAGTPHAVKNVGSGTASELATYLVEKGKTLLVPGR